MAGTDVRVSGKSILGSGALLVERDEIVEIFPFKGDANEKIEIELNASDEQRSQEMIFQRNKNSLRIKLYVRVGIFGETATSNLIISNDETTELIDLRLSYQVLGDAIKHIFKLNYAIIGVSVDGSSLQAGEVAHYAQR